VTCTTRVGSIMARAGGNTTFVSVDAMQNKRLVDQVMARGVTHSGELASWWGKVYCPSPCGGGYQVQCPSLDDYDRYGPPIIHGLRHSITKRLREYK